MNLALPYIVLYGFLFGIGFSIGERLVAGVIRLFGGNA